MPRQATNIDCSSRGAILPKTRLHPINLCGIEAGKLLEWKSRCRYLLGCAHNCIMQALTDFHTFRGAAPVGLRHCSARQKSSILSRRSQPPGSVSGWTLCTWKTCEESSSTGLASSGPGRGQPLHCFAVTFVAQQRESGLLGAWHKSGSARSVPRPRVELLLSCQSATQESGTKGSRPVSQASPASARLGTTSLLLHGPAVACMPH